MICFKCDGGRESAFLKEEVPCMHCDGINFVEYNLCPDCGWLWRSINGEPIEEGQAHLNDLGDFASMFADPDMLEMMPEEQAILDSIQDELKRMERVEKGEITMSDMIHRCLHCNAVAHEIKRGLFKCSDCGFEWEVIRFDE